MSIELKIFIAQFLTVLLLGLQSINVNQGDKISAAVTSLMLGVCGFFVTGNVAVAFADGFGSTVFYSYILAGPIGIVVSMVLHKKIREFINRRNRK